MALWARDLPPVWFPQIPSCNSSRSNFDVSGCMHSRYGPEKDRLYNFWSSDSQNWGAFQRIFSASDLSYGTTSLLRNWMMGSIQLGPTRTWLMQIIFPFSPGNSPRSSTRIIRGQFWADEVANVSRESAWVFSPLGMCCKLNDSNFFCKCLIRVKYPCILSSLASNLPFTWPTTSLESENIVADFPPILWTIDIPSSNASYSASLFVVENPSLSNFSTTSFSGEIKTSPMPDPFWFAAPSTYTFRYTGFCAAIRPTDFSPMRCSFDSFSAGPSANLATKSARTWPLTEVCGMYLMSKVPKIVPHFAILPM